MGGECSHQCTTPASLLLEGEGVESKISLLSAFYADHQENGDLHYFGSSLVIMGIVLHHIMRGNGNF